MYVWVFIYIDVLVYIYVYSGMVLVIFLSMLKLCCKVPPSLRMRYYGVIMMSIHEIGVIELAPGEGWGPALQSPLEVATERWRWRTMRFRTAGWLAGIVRLALEGGAPEHTSSKKPSLYCSTTLKQMGLSPASRTGNAMQVKINGAILLYVDACDTHLPIISPCPKWQTTDSDHWLWCPG